MDWIVAEIIRKGHFEHWICCDEILLFLATERKLNSLQFSNSSSSVNKRFSQPNLKIGLMCRLRVSRRDMTCLNYLMQSCIWLGQSIMTAESSLWEVFTFDLKCRHFVAVYVFVVFTNSCPSSWFLLGITILMNREPAHAIALALKHILGNFKTQVAFIGFVFNLGKRRK